MDLIRQLAEALGSVSVTAQVTDGGLSAHAGSGLQRRAMPALDVAPLGEALAAAPDDERAACIVAWARGVGAVLTEPARGRGADMPFLDATRCVLPSLERAEFFDRGARDAGGDAPFGAALTGPIAVRYYLELDTGMRLLTRSQVDAWGVHPERVEKAALSILFHRTRFGDLAPYGAGDIDAFAVGDGWDAARLVMLDSWDWARCRSGAWAAAPDYDTLLVTRSLDEPGLEAFAALVRERYEAAEAPLWPGVVAFREGRIEGER